MIAIADFCDILAATGTVQEDLPGLSVGPGRAIRSAKRTLAARATRLGMPQSDGAG